jgi:hypothetical protein
VSITIYGASDDLIEIEGDVREEFYTTSECEDDDGELLALSNGCIFRIKYDGCWRITPVVMRAGVHWSKLDAVDEDDDNYSDRVTVDDDVMWVVHGIRYAGARDV